MNRRDLMKFFGAGAVIVPVAASATAARIIEPPKVELVKLIDVPIDYQQVKTATVTLEMNDGTVRQLSIQAYPPEQHPGWYSEQWAELKVYRELMASPATSRLQGTVRGKVTTR